MILESSNIIIFCDIIQKIIPGAGAQKLSCVRLFATPWAVAHLAPLYMEFSRQEHWSGLSLPPPGDLPNLGIEPVSLFLLLAPSLLFYFFIYVQLGKLDSQT